MHFVNEKFFILIQIHWSLFLRIQLTITRHWFYIMARRRIGDKPLSEPMLTHICGTMGRWVNVTQTNSNTTDSVGVPLWITTYDITRTYTAWWRHQMKKKSALLAICAVNSPVPGEFPAQRPVTRSFDVFFDLCLNKWLSKQSWGWWLETISCPLWRHRNGMFVS